MINRDEAHKYLQAFEDTMNATRLSGLIFLLAALSLPLGLPLYLYRRAKGYLDE